MWGAAGLGLDRGLRKKKGKGSSKLGNSSVDTARSTDGCVGMYNTRAGGCYIKVMISMIALLLVAVSKHIRETCTWVERYGR